MRFAFIGGMGRSGTTLLRTILDSHPRIASGPEFDVLPKVADLHFRFMKTSRAGRMNDYLDTEGINALFRHFVEEALSGYARKKGKDILVEKTPSNVVCFDTLSELMPDARFIHMVRDGRDVVCSYLEVGRRYKAHAKRPRLHMASVFHSAVMWTTRAGTGLKLCGPGSRLYRENRALTVRYEDLVLNTEKEVRRVCDFLDVEFHPAMLEHHKQPHDMKLDDFTRTPDKFLRPISRASLARWKREWGLWRRLLFAAGGQEMLEALGYENDREWILSGRSAPRFLPKFASLFARLYGRWFRLAARMGTRQRPRARDAR